MKIRSLVASAGAALVVGTIVAPAFANDPLPYIETKTHGIECKASYGQYAQVGVGEPGSGNFSNSSSLRLFCPVSRSETYDNAFGPWSVLYASVLYGDNNTAQPFSCYIFAVENTGGEYWGATKYTCSQWGGCPDSTSSFTGTGTLSWSNPFPNAFNGAEVGFSCTVPPSASYASWVTSYQTTVQRSGW
jgi:hypothetical protein